MKDEGISIFSEQNYILTKTFIAVTPHLLMSFGHIDASLLLAGMTCFHEISSSHASKTSFLAILAITFSV